MKTAKEILKGHLFVSDEGDIKGHIKFAISAMEEYGKQMYNQALIDAADNADTIEHCSVEHGTNLVVDKDSILNLKK